MKEDVRKALAEIRLEEGKQRLLRHAVVYAGVMAFLVALALFVTRHSLWVVWVALGWGLGLVFHAMRCKRAEYQMAKTG